MAGIIAVYGLVVSVLIVGSLTPEEPYSLYAGFIHLAAGLSCGLTGLAAGHAIGIVGDAVRPALSRMQAPRLTSSALQCARAYMFQSRIFVGMVLMLVSCALESRARSQCSLGRLAPPQIFAGASSTVHGTREEPFADDSMTYAEVIGLYGYVSSELLMH